MFIITLLCCYHSYTYQHIIYAVSIVKHFISFFNFLFLHFMFRSHVAKEVGKLILFFK